MRKLQALSIAAEDVVGLLKGKLTIKDFPLPDDAEYLSASYDSGTDCFSPIFKHESFDNQHKGYSIPYYFVNFEDK